MIQANTKRDDRRFLTNKRAPMDQGLCQVNVLFQLSSIYILRPSPLKSILPLTDIWHPYTPVYYSGASATYTHLETYSGAPLHPIISRLPSLSLPQERLVSPLHKYEGNSPFGETPVQMRSGPKISQMLITPYQKGGARQEPPPQTSIGRMKMLEAHKNRILPLSGEFS